MVGDARRLRISTAEREQALVRLAEALTDGRLEAAEYLAAEERLRQAVTYADVDAVVGTLDAKASLVERDQAIERIEAAVADGLLEPAEQHGRIEAVRKATTDAQLAALVADLTTNTRSPGAPARASHAEREAVAARLNDALEAGFLDLAEFDERVRAAYAARLRVELTRLVADLPAPVRPPAPLSLPPAPPIEIPPERRQVSLASAIAAIVVHVTVGTVAFGAGAAVLAVKGYNALGVLVIVAWLIVLAVLALRGRRAAAADLAAISAPRAAEWTPRAVEPSPRAPDSVARYFAPRAKGRRQQGLSGHKGFIRALTCLVLPDGTPVAISGAQDNTAMVWDLAAHSPRHILSGHTHDVVDVAAMVLPDGVPVAVTVSGDRTARVWDLRDGSPRGTLPGLTGEPRSVACFTLPDGNPAALSLGSGAIRLWDLRNLRALRSFKADFTIDAIVPMVLPGGEAVAVVAYNGIDNVVEIMSLKNGKRRSRLHGHIDTIAAIDATVLPDGTPVAVSASLDKTIRVWDLRQGTLLYAITGMISARRDLICSSLPDGTPIVVAAGFDDDTRVWDLHDGTELGTIALQGGPIAGVALPDRTLIVGTTSGGNVAAVYPLSLR